MCVCSHPIRWYRCVDCPPYQEEEGGVYLQPHNWGVKVCQGGQFPGQLPCNVLRQGGFQNHYIEGQL